MNVDELQEVLSTASGFFSSSTCPAHRHSAPPAARHRDVLRQNQKAERQHPETQHRKKAEQTAGNEGKAEADAGSARPRQAKFAVCNLDLAICYLKIRHVVFRGPPR